MFVTAEDAVGTENDKQALPTNYRSTRGSVVCMMLALHAIVATPGASQRVSGRVVDKSTHSPIAGAVVWIVSPSAETENVVLTGRDGGFRVAGKFTPRFTVRVEMIGMRSWSSSPLVLAETQGIHFDVELDFLPLPLESIRAEVSSRCYRQGVLPPVTEDVWRDVTTALTAERVTREAGRLVFRLETFERDLTPESQVVRDLRSRRISQDPEAFRSVPGAKLRDEGFYDGQSSPGYLFGPTSSVVLAPWFLETHCLVLAPPDERPGSVGLRFSPNRDRRVPEIRGTIWIDASTRDLETIEYQYVSLPPNVPPGSYGGRVQFERLADGSLMIRDWTITSPIVELAEVNVFGRRQPVERDAGKRESGGEVLSALRGQDTLYRAVRAVLRGTVTDSVNGVPLAGARVVLVGTPFEVQADSLGQYLLNDLPGGTYQVTFDHDRVAAFGFRPTTRSITLARGDTSTAPLFIPRSARLLVSLAEIARLDSIAAVGKYLGVDWAARLRPPTSQDRQRAASQATGPSTVRGRVIDHHDRSPIARAVVRLLVTTPNGAREFQVLRTDANGHFEVPRIAAGEYVLEATAIEYESMTGASIVVDQGHHYSWIVRLKRR
jgi:hypothetical protein